MNPKKLVARLVLIALVAVAGYVAWQHVRESLPQAIEHLRNAVHPGPHAPARGLRLTSDLNTNVREVLKRLEVDSSQIRSQLFLEEGRREIRAPIPRGLPPEHVICLLNEAVEHTSYRVTDCVASSALDSYRMTYSSRRPGQEQVQLVFTWADRYNSATAKIAFLVEDFGFEPDETTMKFLSFRQPLTVSMRPTKDRSWWTAKVADHYRKEIVILLCLESKTPAAAITDPIMVHHTEEQISKTIAEAAKFIPDYTGFCNLGGSRLLEDSRATRMVLDEVKRRHGYFVDTKPTPVSLVPQIAAAAQVPYRQADGSIEAGATAARIDDLLRTFVRRAQKAGSALIRVPLEARVIDALAAGDAFFRFNGITLVYVSDVLVSPE